VSNASAFATGIFIAFYYSWQLTLITLGMSPFMVMAGALQAKKL
jgi:ABC-type bacteriocin/lantibiotic exporter with double-glycine peptidase domain